MKNIVCINAVHLSDYAQQPVWDGNTCLQNVIDYAESLENTVKTVAIVSEGSDCREYGCERIELKENTPAGLLAVLKQLGTECDTIVYVYGDCPFIDHALTIRMLENHKKYFAHYSFADGYPYGMSPEIINTSILAPLEKLAASMAGSIERDTLFRVLEKDINAFDLETEISPKDLRLLRLSLTADSKQNYQLCRNLSDAGAHDEETVLRVIEEQPELLRTLPYFYNIQISEGCPQACSYCPYPLFTAEVTTKREFMSLDAYSRILRSIEDFTPEAVISISLWGEPGLHPDIAKMIAKTEEYPGFSLVVETSAVGWRPDILDDVFSRDYKRLSWILSIDSLERENYAKMRGRGYEEAMRMKSLFLEKCPENTFYQAVRLKEHEKNTEAFFKTMQEKTDKIIIQKYDHFCGYLPGRKLTDLSPVNRLPCWHLKRDMNVLLDGSVPMCREDIKKGRLLGNIFSDNVREIWKKGSADYLRHTQKDYARICEHCDEYYTFNF
jgi:spiro-SPASM protein